MIRAWAHLEITHTVVMLGQTWALRIRHIHQTDYKKMTKKASVVQLSNAEAMTTEDVVSTKRTSHLGGSTDVNRCQQIRGINANVNRACCVQFRFIISFRIFMMPKSDQTATVESLLGNSKRQAVLIQHEASCNRKFSSCFFVLCVCFLLVSCLPRCYCNTQCATEVGVPDSQHGFHSILSV